MYKFIDWLIGLSEPLELEYIDEIYKLEEVKNMAYISNAERFGMEKGLAKGREEGREEGMEKGKLDLVRRLLKKGIKLNVLVEASGISAAKIRKLQQAAKKSDH